MSMADTVGYALNLTDVDFDILRHRHSSTSQETAHRAGVTEGCLAKAVALRDGIGPLLAVLPADRELDLAGLQGALRRPGLKFMSEDDLGEVFFDCEKGAVPPLGPDYRVPTIVDTSFADREDIYFEAGDHRDLVHVSGTSFQKLMRGAENLKISKARA
jgi:Ala-tRNA(Pro) deacylase